MPRPDKSRRPKKEAFLAAYASCGIVSKAAEASGVARCAHYKWLKEDPEYAKRFDDSHSDAIESLEIEARRRAVDGWDEPVFHEGKICGHKRKFSDTLLIFLLKGVAPEKYRERYEDRVQVDVDMRASVDVRQGAETLLSNPDYAEFVRTRALKRDTDAGAVCQIREPWDGEPMENGTPPSHSGPGANGHRNGQE